MAKTEKIISELTSVRMLTRPSLSTLEWTPNLGFIRSRFDTLTLLDGILYRDAPDFDSFNLRGRGALVCLAARELTQSIACLCLPE